MDRNQIIGLVLIASILLGYSIFFAPDPPPRAVESNDSTKVTQTTKELKSVPQGQSISEPLSNSITETAIDSTQIETFTVENAQSVYTFSSFGGVLQKVELKGYKTFRKEQLFLIDELSSTLSYQLPTPLGWLDISRLPYTYDLQEVKTENGIETTVQFRFAGEGGKEIIQTYVIPAAGYTVEYMLSGKSVANSTEQVRGRLVWKTNIPQLEKDLKACRINSTVNVYSVENGLTNLGESKTDFASDSIVYPSSWLSHKHKFFTSGVIAESKFTQTSITSQTDESDELNVKYLSSIVWFDASALDSKPVKFTWYYGPNDYKIMEKVTTGFEDNVYLGWTIFGTINRYTIMPLFRFLEQYIASYGIIIIILLIVVKLILSPLSYRSYVSMAKMRLLKPELDILKEKFGDDMTGMQAEQMQIYQKAGVNPLSGCVPVLLQMPIFLALFNFFPNAIELRQEGFLWADDLSSYDNILNLPFSIPFYGDHVSLFTLLMTASTLVYTWYNNQLNPSAAVGPMKTISYIMPVMFLFFLNSFASGLTLYYFVSNVVTIGQQMLIAKLVDEEKLMRIIEENKKKSATKPMSRMQQRLQDAMKSRDQKPATKNVKKPASKEDPKKDVKKLPPTKGNQSK